MKVYVDECDLGNGLFATDSFMEGDIILEFLGPLITLDQVLKMGEAAGNPLQIDVGLYMDIEAPGVYANHSCLPNAGIKSNVKLIAIRPINKGEEIRYDYSTTMWEDPQWNDRWEMDCECQMSNCRKTIQDFYSLPFVVRQRYLELGIVQGFIKAHLQGIHTAIQYGRD